MNHLQTLRRSLSAVSTPNVHINTRWETLNEIYKIYILLHRSDLNNSVEFVQFFAYVCENVQKFTNRNKSFILQIIIKSDDDDDMMMKMMT